MLHRYSLGGLYLYSTHIGQDTSLTLMLSTAHPCLGSKKTEGIVESSFDIFVTMPIIIEI